MAILLLLKVITSLLSGPAAGERCPSETTSRGDKAFCCVGCQDNCDGKPGGDVRDADAVPGLRAGFCQSARLYITSRELNISLIACGSTVLIR